ncbi:HepT-like ribonuclease domain-containing protein [Algoriphagus vanfongensis]|uniref:HepT-like ribonuclease domain-containing protein n=1 Tax=Algoriphagus vanfongensis TaxID=426371 RepID=UPI0003F848AA|nr:HepT-like ribonuclease domain-containing protein [Algoriphagus vanfongensis]
MKEKSLKWLFDIFLSIQEIQGFLDEYNIKSFSSYSQNRLIKRGVERNLAIIGEAMNKIKQTDVELFEEIQYAKAIISLRNHIVHAYDNISDENIWSILINHLPKLNKEVNTLIRK